MPSSTAPEPGSPPIGDEKYVSLTTFTKDGTPKPTPVWIAALPDGRVGFTTGAGAWKTKRIRNTPKVTLQPCDARGRVADGAVEVAGTATVVEQGPELAEVQALIKGKYGLWVPLITTVEKVKNLFSRRPSEATVVIVIELG